MRIFTRFCSLLTVMLLFGPLPGHAQNRTGERLISVDFQQTPYFEALKVIQQITDMNFIYNEKDLEGIQPVTAVFHDAPLNAVIDFILQSKRAVLTYEFVDNTVIIRPRAQANVTLRGTVHDKSSGEALPWATVVSVGTNLGTQTDMDGFFSLTVPNRNMRLRISFVGFKPLDLNVSEMIERKHPGVHYDEGDNSWYVGAFELDVDQTIIQDVIVTGMAERVASSFTGSTSRITYEQIKSTGATNVFQSLQTLDPSLRIFDNMEMGSDPNTMPDFQLRGASKLQTDELTSSNLRGRYQYRPNQPLFILDGFETNVETIFNMDVNRIESITVLKDASAKAIYGSKASNGVVVIESRTMAQTGTLFSINYKLAAEVPDLRSYNLANAREKLQFEYDNGMYFSDTHFSQTTLDEYYKLKRLIDEGLDTYWLSKPLRTGMQHTVSGMIEFGDNNLRNSLNFSGNFDQGVMKGSARDNLGADLMTIYRTPKLNFRNMLRVGHTKSTDSPYGSFSQYPRMNPYAQPYDGDGKVNRYIVGSSMIPEVGNPLYDATLPQKLENTSIELSENMELEWITPVPFLRLTAQVGVNHRRYTDHRFYPGEHSMFQNADQTSSGSYDYGTGESTAWTATAMAVYSATFREKHALFFTGRFDVRSEDYTELLFQVEGFQSNNMASIIYGKDYKSESRPVGLNETRRSLSVLGTLSYSYDDRYAADFNIRRDASSVFSDNHKWTTSFSAGVRWNLHNERFMWGAGFEKLVLRATVGTTGNQNQGQNYSVYSYSPDNWYFPWMPGATVNMMENKNLLWEKKVEYNLGFDFTFRRLDFSLEYYENNSSNMVISMSTAPSVGFSEFYQNLGEVRNNGFELSLGYAFINRQDAFLRGRFQMTTNRNRLRKLSDAMREFNKQQEDLASQEGYSKPILRYVDGQDMGTIWAVKSYGIDPVSGDEMFRDKNGNMTTEWDATDMIAAGSVNTPLNGVFGLNGMWKNWRLDVSMLFQTGGQIYNQTLITRVEDADPYWNVDRRAIYNRWQNRGDEARYDRTVNGPRTKATTRFVQDLTVFKLSALQLGYEFGERVIQKMRVKRLELTLSADNLWQYWSVGFERGTEYPFSRTFRLGLTATF